MAHSTTATPTNPAPVLISVAETARISSVDQKTIRRGVQDGTIPAKRLGRRILIPRQAFLDSLPDVPNAKDWE